MTKLELYRLFFRAVLDQKSCMRVANDSTEHAIVLVEELIGHAKHTVDIFAHQLNVDVWGRPSIRQVVAEAVSRGVSFRVVVQNRNEEMIRNSAFASMENQVLMYDNDNVRSNFMIVDRSAFRFERDHSERKGFAYACKPDLAGMLVNAFEAIYQSVAK